MDLTEVGCVCVDHCTEWGGGCTWSSQRDDQTSSGHSTIGSSLLLFSHSLMSESLLLHGLQHTKFPCLSHLLEFAQTHVH